MSDVTRYVSMMRNTLASKGRCIRSKTLRKIAGRAINRATNEQERVKLMVDELRKICRA